MNAYEIKRIMRFLDSARNDKEEKIKHDEMLSQAQHDDKLDEMLKRVQHDSKH